MKPAPFDYVRPGSLAEACALLAGDEDARVIAGGQTLVPMLAMRLARPARLVDILRLPELAGISEQPGAIVIGATTRQAQAERDPLIGKALPMLARVLPWVGHPPTRNRGTIGGSIAERGSVRRNPAGRGDAGRRDRARIERRHDVGAGGRFLHRADADRDRPG